MQGGKRHGILKLHVSFTWNSFMCRLLGTLSFADGVSGRTGNAKLHFESACAYTSVKPSHIETPQQQNTNKGEVFYIHFSAAGLASLRFRIARC